MKSVYLASRRRGILAAAIATVAAFVNINLFPERFGFAAVPKTTVLIFSVGLLALMAAVLRAALHQPTPEDPDAPQCAQARKMSTLWSIGAAVLSASLFRHPLAAWRGHGAWTTMHTAAVACGCVLLVLTALVALIPGARIHRDTK